MSEEATPLIILGNRIAGFRPPLLTYLLEYLSGSEDYLEFVNVVKELLPDYELAILGAPNRRGRIVNFIHYFEEKFFPLHPSFGWADWIDEYSYYDLLRGIPITSMSFSSYGYHDLPSEEGAARKLMSFLVPSPFDEEAARIPLGESCREYVSLELLQKVPEKGFELKDLEKWLKGTKYDGLFAWAEIVTHEADSEFLAWDDEDIYSGMELPPWDLENAVWLTEEWNKGQAIWKRANDLLTEVEKDPAGMFEKILNFIFKRKRECEIAEKDKPEGLLIDIFAVDNSEKEGEDGEEESEEDHGDTVSGTLPVVAT